MATNENIPPSVINRLMREVREYLKSPVEGISLVVNEENLADLRADIEGPEGTPYEGGLFRIRLVFGADFPSAPPKGFFTTQIFHPNVSKTGEICVNTLKRDWKPENTVQHVLQVIRCLLIEPNAESALNEEAGRMLLEEFEVFAQRARLLTRIHAPKAASDSSASSSSSSSSVSNGANSGSHDAEGDEQSPTKKAVSGAASSKDKAAADKKKLERKRSLKRL